MSYLTEKKEKKMKRQRQKRSEIHSENACLLKPGDRDSEGAYCKIWREKVEYLHEPSGHYWGGGGGGYPDVNPRWDVSRLATV